MELAIALLLAAVFASAITNKVFGSGQVVEYVLIEPVPFRRRVKQASLVALAIVALAVWGWVTHV